MSKSKVISYGDLNEASNYGLWASYSPSGPVAHSLTLEYFGNVKGKKVIDFGCGNGSFLKQCLQNGASEVVGLDKSSSMIETSKYNRRQSMGQSVFMVHDCSTRFDNSMNDYFDLATSHFALQNCSTFDQFETYLSNMYKVLKDGGMAIFCMPRMAKNEREQKDGVQVFGFVMPIGKGFFGPEPIRWSMDFLKPDVERGDGFLKETWFTAIEYGWSDEILRQTMCKIGFTDIQLIHPKISLSRYIDHKNHNIEASCCCLLVICKR